MLSYQYTARNPATGQLVKAMVEADSEAAAAKLISGQGLVPVNIKLGNNGSGALGGLMNHVAAKDRVLFSRQLSTLINAGLPLVQALRSASQQTVSKPLKVILSQIIGDVEGGATLSAAMGKHPRIFNQVYISLVAAGESSGTLDTALERLANQQEKDADIVAKIRGAMIYPLIVLLVMVGVLVFMLVKVLPQVQTLYASLPGTKLPLITVWLLALSNAIRHFWWIFIIVIIVLAVFTGRWARSVGGKRFFDKMYLKLPGISRLFMKMYMARFSRTATTLVASGVPILQVLDITAKAVNNVYLQDSLRRASEKVKAGKGLGESLTGDPNFLELVPNMIKIGEQSGAMEQMLSKAADYYEKELDNEIKNIQTIIEPVMMIMMGIMAFIIVAAVLLPIYGLAGQSSLTGS